MAKDFRASLNHQTSQHESSILKTKISKLESDKLNMTSKIEELEKLLQNTDNISSNILSINIKDIKLLTNVRGNEENTYDYEEIKELSQDIEKHGQLQPVLISKDNFLIAGFRRYKAIELLKKEKKIDGEILAYKYHKASKEIDNDELLDIQLAENLQRREIDNFQLSQLYNDLIKLGQDQKMIAERFKKSKSFVSKVVTINKIHPNIIKLIKQFQVYGYSEKKLNAFNSENIDNENLLKEIEKKKGIVGIIPLCNIGKFENDVEEQKKVFLKLFGDRLSSEDLKDEFFGNINLDKPKMDFSQKGLKQIKSLNSLLKKYDSEFNKIKEYQSIKSKVKELELLIKKLK